MTTPPTTTETPFLIPVEELERLLHTSRRTLADMVIDGRLPAPVTSSPARRHRIFWIRDEVVAAIKQWPRATVRASATEQPEAA